MTPRDYIAALYAAGIPRDLPLLDLDRAAAELLAVDERTTRRYRRGEIAIPGPVRVALECLGRREEGR